MMFYFFDTRVKCEGMSKESEYLIKQCIVWSVLDHVNGWLPGITLEYGNGLNDRAGHGLAGHMAYAWFMMERSGQQMQRTGKIFSVKGF